MIAPQLVLIAPPVGHTSKMPPALLVPLTQNIHSSSFCVVLSGTFGVAGPALPATPPSRPRFVSCPRAPTNLALSRPSSRQLRSFLPSIHNFEQLVPHSNLDTPTTSPRLTTIATSPSKCLPSSNTSHPSAYALIEDNDSGWHNLQLPKLLLHRVQSLLLLARRGKDRQKRNTMLSRLEKSQVFMTHGTNVLLKSLARKVPHASTQRIFQSMPY